MVFASTGRVIVLAALILASGVMVPLVHAGPAILPAAPASVELMNGDFEMPVVSQVTTVSAEYAFDHWIVSHGSVDLVPSSYWQPASGLQSVDLSGGDRGTIVQYVHTVPGRLYTLTFALAGNPVCGPTVKTMSVLWGPTVIDTLEFDTTGHSTSDMGWQTHTEAITATEQVSRLAFQSLTPGSCGPALDNVTLAVP